MQLHFQLDDPHSPQLRLDRSVLTGRTKLYVNEQEVAKEPKNGLFDPTQSFQVPMADGSQRRLTLKNRFYDLVPEASVDGRPLHLAKPLQSWEYVLACLPILLLFVGGALGGLVGVLTTFANLSIMRSARPTTVRVLLCLGLSALAAAIFILAATLIHLAVNGE